jgi:dihydrofolate synthase/folylpolyglutamate synthase
LANVKKLTGIHGRWDKIGYKPDTYCDVAHNCEGISEILQHLNKHYPRSKYHFVMGFVKDKDLNKVIAMMPTDANYYFSNAHIPRALPHHELLELALNAGLSGKSFDDVNDALASATQSAKEDDAIVVCGSFFILSELKNVSSL